MADESIVLDATSEDLVTRLSEARLARGQWEKVEKGLRDELVTLLRTHDASVALTASGAKAMHLSRSERVTVDAKKLEAMHPAVYAQCTKITEVVKLTLDI